MDWAQAGIGLGIGAALGYAARVGMEYLRGRSLKQQAEQVLCEAHAQAELIRQNEKLKAIEEAAEIRAQAEREVQQIRTEVHQLEAKVLERERILKEEMERLNQREAALHHEYQNLLAQQRQLEEERKRLQELERQRREKLQEVAHLSEEEARLRLLHEVEQESLKDANDLSRHILEEARANAEREARRIISICIQRYAAPVTNDLTTCSVSLNGADIKGRIIGRDGRNIRAFEAATGVTVLIDEAPDTVVLSGFDPVRREIARQAMERLIADGRIHPTRIEEVVAEVRQQIEETIIRAGEEAVARVGLPPLHPEIIQALGRLKFRRSYTQNILEHSIEVAHLCSMLAAEIGASVPLARRAGLLHDIGKAIDHEIEGSHAKIGADFLRRLGEPEEIVNAVASHHNEVPPSSEIGVLVGAADAISASRPGARAETTAHYIKRMEALEQIGQSFPGVDKCYALQAGRELRVIVRPEELTDEQAKVLARNLARKIENELQYPGQIRVTVIRETRCVEYAK